MHSIPDDDAEKPRVWKLLLTVVFAGLLIAPLLWALRGREFEGNRASTSNRMQQWGLVFAMYSNESEGEKLPPLADLPGRCVPDLGAVYPEYLSNPALLVGREHPETDSLTDLARAALTEPLRDYDFAAKVMAESFAYLNYVVTNEAELLALVEARRDGSLVDALGATTPPAESSFYATRSRPGCVFIVRPEDLKHVDYPAVAPSSVPVLIEIATWRNRSGRKNFYGSLVLFQDGHVEFVPLGTFPILPAVLDTLTNF